MTAALLAAALAGVTVIPLDAAARRDLPAATATLAAHGATRTCRGVALADLAARAGVPSGAAVKGEALATVIVAEGADGYRVVFSLGEIDATLGKTPIIVADRCDAAPLGAAEGPLRLVVPGDSRGARSVRQLVRLDARAVPR